MDAVSAIFLGVISSLIASFIFEFIRSNSSWFPGPSDAPDYIEPESQHDSEEYERKRNREKLGLTLFNLFFYFYTFFIVYIALLVPPVLTTLLGDHAIYLSDARFIGRFLPDVEVGSSYIQSAFVFIALIFYIPLLIVITAISHPVSRVVRKLKRIDLQVWRAIQSLLFLLFSSCLSILSIYVFNDITLRDAFLIFFVVVALAVAFMFGGKK